MSASRIATSETSGQVQALPQQVDPDEHVELAQPQVAQDLDALQRVDLRVQVAHADPHLDQVVGEVLGHLLRERGDEDALVALGPLADLLDQVVDLALRRPDLDLGSIRPVGRTICSTTRFGLPQLVGARRRGHEHDLVHALGELVEPQRAVVDGARQPEAVLDQRRLARHVALVHAVELRHGHVGLVDHHEVVVGEVVEQRVRRGAGARARRCAGSSSRCRCRTRPRASSPGRRRCACAGAPPPAACPGRSSCGEPLVQLVLDRDERALHALLATPRSATPGRS